LHAHGPAGRPDRLGRSCQQRLLELTLQVRPLSAPPEELTATRRAAAYSFYTLTPVFRVQSPGLYEAAVHDAVSTRLFPAH
jgi:hypothetical protein